MVCARNVVSPFTREIFISIAITWLNIDSRSFILMCPQTARILMHWRRLPWEMLQNETRSLLKPKSIGRFCYFCIYLCGCENTIPLSLICQLITTRIMNKSVLWPRLLLSNFIFLKFCRNNRADLFVIGLLGSSWLPVLNTLKWNPNHLAYC